MRHFGSASPSAFTVVRYDGPRHWACLTNSQAILPRKRAQLDLEAVLKAVNADRPGAAGNFGRRLDRRPLRRRSSRRCEQLILYGAYARGARARPDFDAEEDEGSYHAGPKGLGPRHAGISSGIHEVTFFGEDADAGLIAHLTSCSAPPLTATPQPVTRLRRNQRGDATEMFSRVDVPTLVIHCQNDLAVPADEGRLLAPPFRTPALVPAAEQYPLFSRRQRDHRKSRICNRTFRIRRLSVMRDAEKGPSSDEAFCNYLRFRPRERWKPKLTFGA
jgi:pimeloyl-ACP methyl ester carboxylesterase